MKNFLKKNFIFIASLVVIIFVIFFSINSVKAETGLTGDPRQKSDYDTIFPNNTFLCDFGIDITYQGKGPNNPPILKIVKKDSDFGKDDYWDKLDPPGWDPLTWEFTLVEAVEARGAGYADDNYFFFECSSGNCEKMAIQVNANGSDWGGNASNIHAYWKPKITMSWFFAAQNKYQINGNFCASDSNHIIGFLQWASQEKNADGGLINRNNIPFATTKTKSVWESIELAFGAIIDYIGAAIDKLGSFVLEELLIVDIRSEPTTHSAIKEAWGIVRNASNILLILGLLFIAVANAIRFQIDYYTAKMLLPRLIIAAIFINFSFIMTMTIIDLANVLTHQFIKNINFLQLIIPSSMLSSSSAGSVASLSYLITMLVAGAFGGYLAAAFLGVFALTVVAIAILTLIIMLILRMAVLDLLVIFSPLVFLFSVLPFTRSLTSTWWTYLAKWTFMGPVIALILLVASKL